MNILFVSEDFSGASLCHRLKLEGNEVTAVVGNPVYRRVMDGIIEKTGCLDSGLKSVGKEELVVFDDTGFGKLQDTLRKEGFSVVGGSEAGDRLEEDRPFAQQTLSDLGINTVIGSKATSPSASWRSVFRWHSFGSYKRRKS